MANNTATTGIPNKKKGLLKSGFGPLDKKYKKITRRYKI
jgi:hypothetical protein